MLRFQSLLIILFFCWFFINPERSFSDYRTSKSAIDNKTKYDLQLGPVQKKSPQYQILVDPQDRILGNRNLCFSPGGKYLASCFFPRFGKVTLTIWNLQTRKVEHLLFHPCQVYTIRFVKNTDCLLSGGEDGKIRVWDYKKGELLETLVSPDRHAYGIRVLDVSPDGLTFASGDRNLTLWDWATRKPTLVDLAVKDLVDDVPRMVAYAPDGKTLVGIFSWRVRIWESHTGKKLQEYYKDRWVPRQVVYAPNGKSFVTVDGGADIGNDWVRLWNPQDCKNITEVRAFGNIYQVGYTPDSRYLLAGGMDRPGGVPHYLRIWELATGKQVRAFPDVQGGAFFSAVSPDGKWLATGSSSVPQVRLYEMKDVLEGKSPE